MIKYRICPTHTVRVPKHTFKKLYGGPHKSYYYRLVKTIGSGYRYLILPAPIK